MSGLSGGSSGSGGGVGSIGPQGIQGEKGDTGTQGNTGLKGDAGDQGVQGNTGLKGDAGDQGVQGGTGLKGDTGDQGVQGGTGLKGDTGEQGLQGVQGVAGTGGGGGSAEFAIFAVEDNYVDSNVQEWSFGEGGGGIALALPYDCEVIGMMITSTSALTFSVLPVINGVAYEAGRVSMVLGVATPLDISLTPISLLTGSKLNFVTKDATVRGGGSSVLAILRKV